MHGRTARCAAGVCFVLAACGAPSATQTEAVTTSAACAPITGAAPSAAADRTPKATRPDVTIRKVLETRTQPIRLALDPRTNDLYYLDGSTTISRINWRPDGTANATRAFGSLDLGVPSSFVPAGMVFGPDGALYVLGNRNGVNTNEAIVRKGVAAADGKRTWTTIVTTVPYPKSNTQFDHLFNGMAVSADNQWLYLNSGSRTDHGEVENAEGAYPNTREVPLTASIFRVPTTANNLLLPNDAAKLRDAGYLFASGTRNSYDPSFAPDGELFAGDNGPDADYPDELNWLRQGAHYGFPWRFGTHDNPQQFRDYNPATDKRLQPDFFAVKSGRYHNDPQFPAPPVAFRDPVINRGPDANYYRDADGSERKASDCGVTLGTFTPHRSPLGLTFDTERVLSDEFRGDGFILSWGAAAGNQIDRGADLLHIKLTKVGDIYEAQMTALARDFNEPIDSVLRDGKLYVLDYGGSGALWEITLP